MLPELRIAALVEILPRKGQVGGGFLLHLCINPQNSTPFQSNATLSSGQMCSGVRAKVL